MLRSLMLVLALVFVGIAPSAAEAGHWQHHQGYWYYYDNGHWYCYDDGNYYYWSGGDWRFYAPWSRGYRAYRPYAYRDDGRYWPYRYEDGRRYEYRYRGDRYRERYRDNRRFGVETPWGGFEFRRR